MAKNISLIAFRANHEGKMSVRKGQNSDGEWNSLAITDSEGDVIYINPSKDSNGIVKDSDGNVLVDFNKPQSEIVASLKANKEKLVVLMGNKNWEDPEEDVIPVYTLAAMLKVEELEFDL